MSPGCRLTWRHWRRDLTLWKKNWPGATTQKSKESPGLREIKKEISVMRKQGEPQRRTPAVLRSTCAISATRPTRYPSSASACSAGAGGARPAGRMNIIPANPVPASSKSIRLNGNNSKIPGNLFFYQPFASPLFRASTSGMPAEKCRLGNPQSIYRIRSHDLISWFSRSIF